CSCAFCSHDTAATVRYALSLHDALPICGASLTGGKGTILGATVGAVLMAVLQNGSNLLGISPFVQRMVIGALIVVAVGVDVWRRSEEHTSELQSRVDLVCRLLLEKKKHT